MKNIVLLLLLTILTFGMVLEPSYVLARGGSGSDSGSSHHDEDEDEDEDEDDDEDDEDDEDDTSGGLEIEADVFTDTTVVKVEKNDVKTIFTTDADTRAEVVTVVAEKFDLTETEVEDVLDFEVENRASRVKERATTTNSTHDSSHDDEDEDEDDSCDSDDASLEVEADVFTDTTIVKVEKNGSTTVFDMQASTSAEVAREVSSRFGLTEAEVSAVLDFEVEDRASRATDRLMSTDRDCDQSDDSSNNTPSNNDRALQERIAKLQELLQLLIRLFEAQFGNIR